MEVKDEIYYAELSMDCADIKYRDTFRIFDVKAVTDLNEEDMVLDINLSFCAYSDYLGIFYKVFCYVSDLKRFDSGYFTEFELREKINVKRFEEVKNDEGN